MQVRKFGGIAGFLFVLLFPGIGRSDDIHYLRNRIETVREDQRSVLRTFNSILEAHRSGVRDSDLLYALGALIRVEERVLEGIRTQGRLTFGRSLQQLTEDEKAALEKLAGEQASARERYGTWWENMRTRIETAGRADLARVGDHLREIGPDRVMEQIRSDVEGNRLAQAARTVQPLIDGLRTAYGLLQNALMDPREAAHRAFEQIKQILKEQEALRDETVSQGEGSDSGIASGLSLHQSQLRRRTHAVMDVLMGAVPTAATLLRGALEPMEQASIRLGRGHFPEAAELQEEAIAALGAALEAIQKALLEMAESSNMMAGDQFQLPGLKDSPMRQGLQMMLARAAAGHNPLAEVLADLNSLIALKRDQLALRQNVERSTPVQAASLVSRQNTLAETAIVLSGRIEVYEPYSAQGLKEAERAMRQASAHLTEAEFPPALEWQNRALGHLNSAEDFLQDFWEELLAAMTNMLETAEGGFSMSGGGEGKPLDPATRKQLLTTLFVIVDMNRIAKDQEALIARIEAAIEEERFDMGRTFAELEDSLARRILTLSGTEDLDPHLAGHLMGVWDRMIGSRIMLEVDHLEGGLELARAARQWIHVTVSSVTSSMGQVTTRTTSETEEQQFSGASGEEGSAGMMGIGNKIEAWLVELPARDRERIGQAHQIQFPLEYAPAIQAYFEALAERDEVR